RPWRTNSATRAFPGTARRVVSADSPRLWHSDAVGLPTIGKLSGRAQWDIGPSSAAHYHLAKSRPESHWNVALQFPGISGAEKISPARVVPGIPSRERRRRGSYVRQRLEHFCARANQAGYGTTPRRVQIQIWPS